ncbi:unnamed protein product [Zymoseptoria tritici ST99CH_1E4]|uniref:RING-type E3 ubiquitin transferase n=2 Tax=Zymoseptoria tritici TaxID=1047171 RepID=A0A2H1FJ47_ZYMTR|nr:unnamed protein product [Zymoseptoria tritici ST99CH_1E4]
MNKRRRLGDDQTDSISTTQQHTGGSTRATAIDLTTPPRPPRAPRPSFSSLATRPIHFSIEQDPPNPRPPPLDPRRRHNSHPSTMATTTNTPTSPRPEWQPDGNVVSCPVCHTIFGLFTRKHHCRKCGRVVCSACSPHRITIPRQYIVTPEGQSQSPNGHENPALGGGEVVRVCNPCVPDPWTPAVAAGSQRAEEVVTAAAAYAIRALNERVEAGRGDSTRDQPQRYRPILPPPPHQRNRSHTHQPSQTSRVIPSSSSYVPAAAAPRPAHRYRTSIDGNSLNRPSPSSHPTAPQPPPRRQIREEDECPVCGTELPPISTLRETHIQHCISTRFNPSMSNSLPAPSPASPPSHLPGPAPANATPPRFRPRGMAIYHATEKDCVDPEGGSQECTICLEDFEEGEVLARMECLCKFHRRCVRGWWTSQPGCEGECPTHKLSE